MIQSRLTFIAVFVMASVAHAATSVPMKLVIGDAKTVPPTMKAIAAKLQSSDPSVAKVYSNGYIVALSTGTATVSTGSDAKVQILVTVDEGKENLRDASTIKQFKDDQVFHLNGRKCVGCELNGTMAGNAQADELSADRDHNRVKNPKPIAPKQEFFWEIEPDTPVLDGTGVLMGNAKAIDVGGKNLCATKINYGMSKVINGDLYVYAFDVKMAPTEQLKTLLATFGEKHMAASTSAWIPLDKVKQKETLLQELGVGKGKLPHIKLEDAKYEITGGDAKEYNLPNGAQLRIIPNLKIPAEPDHYLRRPSGTINIIYSVPGYALGGQGLDSILINSHATFRPAKGIRTFVMPTFYTPGDPNAGKKAEKTMTFIYGAVEVPKSETIYGWVAKEALSQEGSSAH